MCFQCSTNNFNQLGTPFREDILRNSYNGNSELQGPALQPVESSTTWGVIASKFLQWKICLTRKQTQLGNPNKKWYKQGLQLLPPLARSSGALKKNFISCRQLSSPRAFPYSFSTAETVSCIHLKATPQTETNSISTELNKTKSVRKMKATS